MRLRASVLALLAAIAVGFTTAGATGAQTQSVRLGSRVVVIPAAIVRRYLLGTSNGGQTLRFRSTGGGLGRLRAGSVLLVPGSDAVAVKAVRHVRGQLLVLTKAATLAELMPTGTIHFQGTPNVRDAFPVRLNTGISTASPAFTLRSRPGARPADAGSFTAQGSVDNWGFVLTFTPSPPSRLDISGVVCYQYGEVCSAGPSRGFSAEINVNGYIDLGQADVGVTMTDGHLDHSLFSLRHLIEHTHLTYTITSGDQKDHGNPPLLRIPFGVDWPVIGPAGIPLYFKVQLAMLLKFGITSYGAIFRGGADVTSGSSDTVTENGRQVSATGSGVQVEGGPLTHEAGQVGPSESYLPSAVVVGFEGQLGAGIGVRMGNLMGFLNGVIVLTQQTAPAFGGLAGVDCSTYNIKYSLTAGMGAQVGPFSLTGPPRDVIPPREATVKETGC